MNLLLFNLGLNIFGLLFLSDKVNESDLPTDEVMTRLVLLISCLDPYRSMLIHIYLGLIYGDLHLI